jgi:hypothetical protein
MKEGNAKQEAGNSRHFPRLPFSPTTIPLHLAQNNEQHLKIRLPRVGISQRLSSKPALKSFLDEERSWDDCSSRLSWFEKSRGEVDKQ